MDENYRSDLNRYKYTQWNQLTDTVMFTTSESFVFPQRAFFFRMMLITINKLIDTGIMKHLLDNHFKNRKYLRVEDELKVLDVDDLAFGFNIWLGFCVTSCAFFVLEKLSSLRHKSSKLRKCKHAKIHPVGNVYLVEGVSLKSYNIDYYDKFKIGNSKKVKEPKKFALHENSLQE